MNVELATNERGVVKPRGGEAWRGASELMRWLGLGPKPVATKLAS